MKKTILLILTVVVCAAIFTVSCNNDDKGPAGVDTAVGTWKLIEAYEGTQTVSLTSCQLLETYIIGQDGQFSHELFGPGAGRPITTSAHKGGSGNVMNGDDDGDDDGGDDGDDDGGDDGSDDGSDDGGNPGGTCVSSRLDIGYWEYSGSNNYAFIMNNIPDVKNITFIENNTKFFYEVTTVVGGVSKTTRYVFQRQ